jgi:sugar phosphate isomerase/epimerase
MLLAYNTNGLANHDLIDAIELLAEIGYQGISITLDHAALNPYDDRLVVQLDAVFATLAKHDFRSVIETGARYFLDAATKHEPTLVTPDPGARVRRIDFLCRAIDIASDLRADCVSLWSGIVHDRAEPTEAWSRLVNGLAPVLDYANERDVDLAFEPEPGMLVDTLSAYDELVTALESHQVDTSRLKLTIDIGHLFCQGETPISAKIKQYSDRLVNVHIEDMRPKVHEHLMFGEGEIDFPPVIAALREIGYHGVLSVELSRHSHDGPAAARRAYSFLRPLLDAVQGA